MEPHNARGIGGLHLDRVLEREPAAAGSIAGVVRPEDANQEDANPVFRGSELQAPLSIQ